MQRHVLVVAHALVTRLEAVALLGTEPCAASDQVLRAREQRRQRIFGLLVITLVITSRLLVLRLIGFLCLSDAGDVEATAAYLECHSLCVGAVHRRNAAGWHALLDEAFVDVLKRIRTIGGLAHDQGFIPIAEPFEVAEHSVARSVLGTVAAARGRAGFGRLRRRGADAIDRHALFNQALLDVLERVRAIGSNTDDDRLLPVLVSLRQSLEVAEHSIAGESCRAHRLEL